jgi:pilus assembly protein CpaE
MLKTAWSSDLETPTFQDTDALGGNVLSVAVIGPDERRREMIAGALAGSFCGVMRQLPFYPDMDHISKLIELNYDVVIMDLDSNPEYALDVVENLCAASQATVMMYTASADTELMIRCMRAGARELLSLPLNSGALPEAMVRASVRRSSVRTSKKAEGRLCVFWGAKGGSGVTTVATNFAVSTAREAEQKVILIDLDLPLGDVALNLGITPQYSTVDALQNHRRLDANFLSRLTVAHSSGISVLAAPGKLMPTQLSTAAVDKLINVARQEFDCVVVDSGSHFDLTATTLFAQDALIYLVSQVSIPELRNSNRLVSELFSGATPRLQIVLNRFSNSSLAEEHITKALTRRADWKLPDDIATARKTQVAATPMALGDSVIARTIRQMARTATGLSAEPEKKKKIIGLF